MAVRDTDAVGHRTAARTTTANQTTPPAGDNGDQWRQWHRPLGIGAAAVVRSQAAAEAAATADRRPADGTGAVRTGRRRRKGRKSGDGGGKIQRVAGSRRGRQKAFDVGRFVVGRRRRRSDVRCPTKRFTQVRGPRQRDGQRFVVVTLTTSRRRKCGRAITTKCL